MKKSAEKFEEFKKRVINDYQLDYRGIKSFSGGFCSKEHFLFSELEMVFRSTNDHHLYISDLKVFEKEFFAITEVSEFFKKNEKILSFKDVKKTFKKQIYSNCFSLKKSFWELWKSNKNLVKELLFENGLKLVFEGNISRKGSPRSKNMYEIVKISA